MLNPRGGNSRRVSAVMIVAHGWRGRSARTVITGPLAEQVLLPATSALLRRGEVPSRLRVFTPSKEHAYISVRFWFYSDYFSRVTHSYALYGPAYTVVLLPCFVFVVLCVVWASISNHLVTILVDFVLEMGDRCYFYRYWYPKKYRYLLIPILHLYFVYSWYVLCTNSMSPFLEASDPLNIVELLFVNSLLPWRE